MDNLYFEIIKSILFECMNQLKIIEVIAEYSENETRLEFQPIQEKINTLIENKDKFNNFEKLQYDFSIIKTLIEDIFKEILNDNSYKVLKEFNKNIFRMQREEEKVFDDFTNFQHSISELKNQIEKEKFEYYESIFERMDQIGLTKDQIEDLKTESEIKLKYLKKWYNAKYKAEIYRDSKNEKELKKKISDTKNILSKELRIHAEVVRAYGELYKDCLQSIEEWIVKHENDLKLKIDTNDELRTYLEELRENRRKMQELYEHHKQAIIEYKALKAQKAAEKLELQRRNEAATRIQAWWRGTMVRKGLGKYRKKKSKKSKAKGAADKKSVKK